MDPFSWGAIAASALAGIIGSVASAGIIKGIEKATDSVSEKSKTHDTSVKYITDNGIDVFYGKMDGSGNRTRFGIYEFK